MRGTRQRVFSLSLHRAPLSLIVSSELRKVGRHTLVYGVGVVASKLVSFIMLPVYTRYLTTTDYGVLELLSTTIDVIGMIGGIGLAGGVFKHYAEADSDPERRRLISTVMIGTIGLSFLITAAGVLASPRLTDLLFGQAQTALYFRLFFVIYFFQTVGTIGLLLVQAQERSELFVGLNVAKLLATLALTIWLVVGFHWGIKGILLANLAVTAVFTVYLAVYTFRYSGFSFSWPNFTRLSRFGGPVAVWMIGSFILTFSDRYFLNHYSGSAAVGVYSLAYKFSFLLSAFAVAPFSQIWEPRRFSIARRSDASEIYRRMFTYLNLALFGGSILIILFIKIVLTLLVTPDFLPAYKVVPLLLVTTIVQQWTAYCNLGLYLKNATHLYAWSALIGVVAALALNALLIPRFGMFGAAWATVGAYAIRFVPVYIFAQSKYHVDYAWAKVAELGVIGALTLTLGHFANALPIALSVGANLAILFSVGALVYVRLLDVDERAFVRSVARRPLSFRAIAVAQDIT